MSISEYLVFYIVRETEHMVEIHRVLHSSRNARVFLTAGGARGNNPGE
jgi:hypothetical protein